MKRRKKRQQISKFYIGSTIVAVLLMAFCVCCRFSTGVADWYATFLYPIISVILSRISSLIPFSLQGVSLVLLFVAGIAIIVVDSRKKVGLWRGLLHIVTLLLWVYVWFYMAWCNNYGRSNIFVRTSTEKQDYDEEVFTNYLYCFARDINTVWTSESVSDTLALQQEVKAFYEKVPTQYGLIGCRDWHKAKHPLINGFYSAVGVQGFMAPLFGESLVNNDVQPEDYPFVYAHEYAHLLGVSSEAEANWWAFQACKSSTSQAIRYSAYKGILGHVMNNARAFLPDRIYSDWVKQIRPEVMEDLQFTRDYWKQLRSETLDTMQTFIYDLFLKSNNIPSGVKNYSEVVELLIALERPVVDDELEDE